MIMDCLRAELFKLSRRPATFVLAGIYAATVMLFNYFIFYLLIRSGQLEEAGPGINPEEILSGLLPSQFTAGLVSTAASFGASVALILGALAVGSEYGWGTVKTVAVQRPGRGAIVAGRVASVTVITLAYTLVATVTALISSYVIALLESRTSTLPPLDEVLLAVGAAWLLLTVWAALGMALATLFRGSGLAIGIGLVWALVVESLASSLPLPGRIGDVLSRVLLGPNGNALSSYFGDAAAFGAPEPVNTPAQAVLALGIYLVVFALVTTVPFLRREIA